MENRVYLLFGSNIDKERNLPAAIRLLRQHHPIRALSPVYETVPVGLRQQPTFFNVAALITTGLDPARLKATTLTEIERQLKRQRTADRNAPRTIDADIILYDEAVMTYDGRQLPDPDLIRFAHVAVPIADLAPELHHPVTGEPLRQLAARLAREARIANGDRPAIWPRPDVVLAG